MVNFYRPVPPIAVGGPGSVYAHHMTHFYKYKKKVIPQNRISLRYNRGHKNLKKGDQINLMGNTNEYILSKKSAPSPPN